jgi:PIN domain nuclease of toxin-antitoxin system
VRLLLDTNVLYWWFTDPGKLSRSAFTEITNIANSVFVSSASALELALKVNLGKLDALRLVTNLSDYIHDEGFAELPITIEQATRAGLLPLHHRDLFDRLLVSQAQSVNIPILSSDPTLDRYDVKRIW